MIKLVASDLDGTIIGRDNTIFENNLKAINDINNKNIDFVICTGKTYPIIKGMCSKFNASYGIFGNGNPGFDFIGYHASSTGRNGSLQRSTEKI